MQKISNMYLTANTNLVTYPVVKIEVEGVQRKTMIKLYWRAEKVNQS